MIINKTHNDIKKEKNNKKSITEKHKPSAFTDIGILAGTTGGGACCGYAGWKYYLYPKLVKSFKAERARI